MKLECTHSGVYFRKGDIIEVYPDQDGNLYHRYRSEVLPSVEISNPLSNYNVSKFKLVEDESA